MNDRIKEWYEENETSVMEFSRDIWLHPELKMEEYGSCKATASFLEAQGFEVYTCHCLGPDREPNTVVATWGSGSPVVAVFGEYDALPGLGQEAVPWRSKLPGAGHGCGHNLMIAAAVGAACAAKHAMETQHIPGTIKFLACPAEEGGNGKLFMHRLGLFDGIDCIVGWHPEAGPLTANERVGLAIEKLVFEFRGKPAHAAAAPEQGRSAMDAAELMSVGVQYLREHMKMGCRIHHRYLETMPAMNIVPEFASVAYCVRATSLKDMRELADRVVSAAKGAAIMTETQMNYRVISALPGTWILTSFTRFIYESARKIPPLSYTEEEERFAEELYRNVFGRDCDGSPLDSSLTEPAGIPSIHYGSNDLGYTTYTIPTARFVGLGLIRDTCVHHWALTSTAGMSIGQKAAVYVSKAMAQSLVDILLSPRVIEGWKEELKAKAHLEPDDIVWPEN